MNQYWTFQDIFLNNFKYFLEAYSLSKICKIVLEYTLKCSQLVSSSDNKKILLTTRNVWLDSSHYATKYQFLGHDIAVQETKEINERFSFLKTNRRFELWKRWWHLWQVIKALHELFSCQLAYLFICVFNVMVKKDNFW